MKFTLTAKLEHKSWPTHLIKVFHYEGNSLTDVLDQIEAPEHHLHNLKHHRRAKFKDANGVKHTWQLKEDK